MSPYRENSSKDERRLKRRTIKGRIKSFKRRCIILWYQPYLQRTRRCPICSKHVVRIAGIYNDNLAKEYALRDHIGSKKCKRPKVSKNFKDYIATHCTSAEMSRVISRYD